MNLRQLDIESVFWSHAEGSKTSLKKVTQALDVTGHVPLNYPPPANASLAGKPIFDNLVDEFLN